MKDQDMSCKELYEAYDLSEKHKRKWLVKIARYWLKNSINEEANKIINDTLEVVERYIRGEATQKELEDAAASASASRVAWSVSAATAATYAASASDAYAFAATYAATSITASEVFLFVAATAAAAYKEALLEVINEMDELERIIRKKS